MMREEAREYLNSTRPFMDNVPWYVHPIIVEGELVGLEVARNGTRKNIKINPDKEKLDRIVAEFACLPWN